MVFAICSYPLNKCPIFALGHTGAPGPSGPPGQYLPVHIHAEHSRDAC